MFAKQNFRFIDIDKLARGTLVEINNVGQLGNLLLCSPAKHKTIVSKEKMSNLRCPMSNFNPFNIFI
jgi:hypothetical protein